MTLKLKKEWLERLRLRAEGYELLAEGYELLAEGKRLRVKSYELLAEGYELRAEGTKLWFGAIIKAHGNVKMKWIYRDGDVDCHLPNGEIYKWDMREGK